MDNLLIDAIQEWHNTERQNEADYAAMATGAENVNWPGLAKWLQAMADDERAHAGKVAAFLIDKNIQPRFDALEPFSGALGAEHLPAFNAAMDRERLTDATIKEIYALAWSKGEYDACQFMLWFLQEQRESIREITDCLQMIGRDIDLLVFDNGLAK